MFRSMSAASTHPIFGHHSAREALSRAWAAGRLPQVLLVTGEPGVGKQRLGLWLAQLALCTSRANRDTGGLTPAPTGFDGPCGACRACRLVLNLTHPDFHWFTPLPRPKSSDPDKQIEDFREALAGAMAERRERPIYGRPDGMSIHGVASARLLLRIAALTTVEGGPRIILIGDADRLVPQESSPEAANSLLKFLEEPPATTIVILTTTDPTRVLPTIRSRAVPLRLGRLSEAELDAALSQLAPELSESERRSRIARAQGSIGRALDGARAEGGAGLDQVEQLLAAAHEGGVARFERVLRQGAWSARGDFTTLLDRLAEALGGAARASAGDRPDAELPRSLREVRDPARLVRAMAHVDAARESAQGNVNPQLLLATLTADLAEALWH